MYACDIPHAIHMCKILEDLACVQNILDYTATAAILGLFQIVLGIAPISLQEIVF